MPRLVEERVEAALSALAAVDVDAVVVEVHLVLGAWVAVHLVRPVVEPGDDRIPPTLNGCLGHLPPVRASTRCDSEEVCRVHDALGESCHGQSPKSWWCVHQRNTGRGAVFTSSSTFTV